MKSFISLGSDLDLQCLPVSKHFKLVIVLSFCLLTSGDLPLDAIGIVCH